MTPEEQSWLAEVEERVNRALSTIQPEPFWNDFTRLLALAKRLVEHKRLLFDQNTRLLTDLEDGFMQGTYARLKNLQDAERERDTLRSQLEVAKKAMRKPYACTRCGERSDVKWGRACEADEGACCKWEVHLGPALASIEEIK